MASGATAESAPRWREALRGSAPAIRSVGVAWVRFHWPILAVLGCFALSAVIVPTLTPTSTTDDWGYARSVEILHDERELRIFPVVAATAVFQVVWGALFASIFGMTLGVVRLSTVVMVGLGGIALYGICRQLGVSRGRSALGTAAYLFNPLAFVLAFTFMTDPHFTSLLLIATYFYVRGLGLEAGAHVGRFMFAGSVVAAFAFLTRQQGALIPLAVVLYLLLGRRLRPDRAGAALFLRVVAVPAAATIGYYIWLWFFNDVPDVQESFFRSAVGHGLEGTWRQVRFLTFFELMYLGFFTLPLVAAALPAVRRLVSFRSPAGWLLFSAWQGIVIAGVAYFAAGNRRMPYIPQFVGAGGLGPADVLGSRPRLFEGAVFDWATGVCLAATLVLGMTLCRKVGAAATPDRAKAGLILMVGFWQLIGILPPSYHYINRAGSLDRYLLPLLPIAICLALWALRDVRIIQPIAWVVVAIFAIFSIAGTRDYLVFMDEVWDLGHTAVVAGVRLDQLDAGSGWDGYHMYETMIDEEVTRARTPNAPWWISFYAKPIDSSYVVASQPIRGYLVIEGREYSSWLHSDPVRLYLLRRLDVPWPPDGRSTQWTTDRSPESQPVPCPSWLRPSSPGDPRTSRC